MPWIRLEAAGGLRIMAPSFDPPPRVEGIDKLFDHPIHARSFHCFRSSPTHRCTEEIIVLLQRRHVGGKLGDVTVAVGGPAATQDELTVVLDSAFETIRRTDNSGARLVLDALCTSSSSSSVFSHPAAAEVVEYDGLPTLGRDEWGDKRVGEWRATDMTTSPSERQRSEMQPAILARRKGILYFVAQDVLPVSLLHCRMSTAKSHGCVSSVASSPHRSRNDLQSIEKSASHACKCLVNVINRTLIAAFDLKEDVALHILLWNGKFDKLPFVAVFSTNGLLCASSSFFKFTDHRARFLVAAVAVDQLCRWAVERSPSASIPLAHVRELILRCGKDHLVLKLIFLGIGSAVSCVFAFRTTSDDTFWDAATLLRFINQQLITSRTALRLDTMTENNVNSSNNNSNSNNADKDESRTGEVQEFAPHLLLCAASTYPTPWFYRLVYEMNKLEEETPNTVVMPTNGASDGGLPPKLQGSCNCFPLSWRLGKKSTAPTPFVWYTDTVHLSLDFAWCVASSHIVKAEANVCTRGHQLGHYALFSIISSSTKSEEDGVGRYAVGWFQHCWRRTSHAGTDKDSNSGCGVSSTSEADPTAFLRELSSIGGGPCAPSLYEMKGGGGCFFPRKPKVEARTGDDAPVYTSHMMTFPYALLFERNGTEDCGLTTDWNATRPMTAFYTLETHKVKGAACNALLEEMVLMEGDMIDCGDDVVEMMTHPHHSASTSSKAFASCHEAACCVLEDVWRSSFS